MKKNKFSNIESIIKISKKGGMYILVDDENRENEGDIVFCASDVSSKKINFMAKNGRGLICVPMSERLCLDLNLEKMVPNNTDPLETAFTVSVDLKGNGVTSGISASDRAKTVQALVDKNTKPNDLQKPGHVFPLIAKNGGVLRRTGHTEAAIDFARLAGFKSAGVIVEIMNDDGSMSRLPELMEVAHKFNLKIVSIEDLVAYRMKNDSLINKIIDENVVTQYGNYRLRGYRQTNNDQIHVALTLGEFSKTDSVLTRINSSVIDNDVTKILSGTNEKRYDKIFEKINKEGKGAVIFINQNQSPDDIIKKLKSFNNNEDRPKIDFKDYGIGAQILHDLGISNINLLSNSEQIYRVGLSGYGLSIEKHTSY